MVQVGLGLAQVVMGLFGAGSLLYAAHNLFLRYYANEWRGVQFSGVNTCAGEEAIANGDLFSGVTLCNKPVNFVPWIVVYRHHWHVAVLYYGAILLVILLIGIAWFLLQRSRATTTPFGGAQPSAQPSKSEHLR